MNIRFGIPGSQLPARDATRAVRAAEEAGFDSMWWADRLMGWLPEGPHALLDPFPLMGAAAVATGRIHLGTAVTDPLRRHPAQLAQSAVTLQQLSGGRLLLGVGCGEVAGTRPYGIPYEKPVGRLEEALQVMRALWRDGRPVDFAGEHYHLDQALCGLSAVVPAPPVWVAAHGPRTLRITGSRADGWLPTAFGPEPYREALAAVRAAAADAGRAPSAVEAGAFVWLVAGADREVARRLLEVPALRALGLLLPQGALTRTPLPEGPWGSLVPTDPRLHDLVAGIDVDELAGVIPHGSPDDIAATLAAYVDAGAEHLVLCDMSAASGRDNGLGLGYLETHAAIRDACRARLG
ncbi:MAG: LLM class flavin-dependent oxidoreductase [Acidimicrobiia bacterium]|nr:LLM class flavin-dependent oxidoreductase [Acidimicrobiia bacterium]